MYPGKTSKRGNRMLSISSDYSVFDNKETISWKNTGFTEITINNVVRKPSVLSFYDSDGNIVYAAGIEFLIWKYEANDNLTWGPGNNNNLLLESTSNDIILWNSHFTPKLNAEIVDNVGKKYKVNSITDGALRTRWSVQAVSSAGEGTN